MTKITERQYEVRQFKLVNGEEVVCEIIQWHNEEELELVVRKAMKLDSGNTEEGSRYYAFRPWMVYQEDPDELLVINGHHVIGIGFPTPQLIDQFDEAVDDMARMCEERKKEYEERKGLSSTMDMTKKVINEANDLEEYIEKMRQEGQTDSDDSNILQFDPNKRTLH